MEAEERSGIVPLLTAWGIWDPVDDAVLSGDLQDVSKRGEDGVLCRRCPIGVLLIKVVHIGPEVPCGDASDVPIPEPLNQTPVLVVEAPLHCLVGPDASVTLIRCLFLLLDEAKRIGLEREFPLDRFLLLEQGDCDFLGDLLGSYRGRLFRPSDHISLLLSVPDPDVPESAILNLVD